MIINDLLEKEKMSRYRLSKESGVAMTTITDICNGKADLDKCTAGTLHKIAKVLNVTVDSILENNSADNIDYRCSFETFKSNTCHHVKDMGDIDFIIETLETDEVRKLYERRWCREAMYLLAMIDYLSRMNDLPLCTILNRINSGIAFASAFSFIRSSPVAAYATSTPAEKYNFSSFWERISL